MHSFFKKRKLKFSFVFCSFLFISHMSLIKHNIAQYHSRGKTPVSLLLPLALLQLCCLSKWMCQISGIPSAASNSCSDCLTSEPSDECCGLTPTYKRLFHRSCLSPWQCGPPAGWLWARNAAKPCTGYLSSSGWDHGGSLGWRGEEEQLSSVGDCTGTRVTERSILPAVTLRRAAQPHLESSGGGRAKRLRCISLYGSAGTHRNEITVSVPALLRRN